VGIQDAEFSFSLTELQCAVNNVLVDVVRTYLQNDYNSPFTSLNQHVELDSLKVGAAAGKE
jgi:hypothetical protein